MIFPEERGREETAPAREAYKDWAFDVNKGEFVLAGGRNTVNEGLEALKLWIWKTLKTPRNRYAAYSVNYGQDFHKILGTTNFELAKELMEQYVTEALLVHPDVERVSGFEFSRDGAALYAAFEVTTRYGKTRGEAEAEL